jgi:EAL domain-containing protein (putative c-di-GMP-specific phosphodiesterase class I)/GGDEF domain-containing protein/ABC-type amino acid transport substrate-binding protein
MLHKRPATRLLVPLFCAIALLSAFALSARAEPSVPEGDELTVGIPIDRCPIFYASESTGEPTGIGVDLMRTAAEEVGLSVTFTPVEEETLKEALDNDAYDVVMPFGSAITSASGHSTVVSHNLIQTPFTLVTQSEQTTTPLNELRVGMLASLAGGAETVRQLYPGIEIKLYETMADCVDALRHGEVDALLHNSYVWSYVLQKPSYSNLTVQPSAMFSMDFRAGTLDTPEGRALIERLDKGIDQITDTKRQAIILDHTSRRLYRYDLFDCIYEYGAIIILVLLLFVSLGIIAAQWRRSLRLEQEAKMRWLIDHDSLTGVLSLDGFRKRVTDLLREHPNNQYLLTYSNIKGFKYINDSIGREEGDELLRFWAHKTLETLSDEEAIGRLDGDHFAVLRLAEGEERMQMDDTEVIDTVRNYFVDRGNEYRVQVCGGVYVVTPEDHRVINVDHLLDLARVAEKRVRRRRDDGYDFYNPQQWEHEKQSADIIRHLPTALQNGEIQVWYQPQVDYDTGEITGMEALCRWNHAKLGWLSPMVFIPALEQHGLICELDRFVWRKACEDLQRWNQQGLHRSVSVNLSRCDIQDNANIPGFFYGLVQERGLTSDQLHIEITETAFVENPELLIGTTKELRNLGFQVVMDDFGSGYSSLNMLKEVPVDRIKLDLRFLSGTGDPERGRIILSHVISMVTALGMSLIAEGVENVSQASFLQSRGCTEMQGFFFYRPMPVEDLEKLA